MSGATRSAVRRGGSTPLAPALGADRGNAATSSAAGVATGAPANSGSNIGANVQAQDGQPAWLGALLTGLQTSIATAVQTSVTAALGAAQAIHQVPPPVEDTEVDAEDEDLGTQDEIIVVAQQVPPHMTWLK